LVRWAVSPRVPGRRARSDARGVGKDTCTYTAEFEAAVEAAGVGGIEFLHVREFDHPGLHRALGEPTCEPRTRILEYLNRIGAARHDHP
jgi:hypothetical protein